MDEVSKSIARWAAINPGRLAVIDEHAVISYGELHERAGRWAGALQEAGVTPGSGVMLLLPNRAEFIEVLVATIRTDVVPFVLNSQYTPEDILSLAAAAHTGLLITTRPLAGVMTFAREVPFQIWFVEDFDYDRYPSLEALPVRRRTEIVFFTSGTTGKPKGVAVSKALFDLALPAAGSGAEPLLQLLCRPLFFRAHMTAACNILQEGNTVVLSRQAEPGVWTNLIERHRIFFVSLGPSDLTRWLDHLEKGGGKFPPSVKHIMSTGAPLTHSLKKKLKKLLPHLRTTDLYGTSELSAIAMIDDDKWADKEGSCGRPAFFVNVKITDEHGRELPPREVGEVWVKSRYRMREYYQDPEATSRACAGDYVKTGDLGFLDEHGYLYLSGRKHDIINRSGFHFFPGEVENVLQDAPDVEEAVVLGMEHPEQTQEPVAVVRLRTQDRNDAEAETDKKRELLAHCESRLARYKVPSSIWFVGEIPLNAAGKADRRELAQWIAKQKDGTFR
ncbi:class I adenylate-forming enzyme family protein [Paenibacillus beijingensis]|uniref:AMP-dependent synthetase/ligase domain-containing protein n=1 Tax=Paenibacillus beijingensis TaxID=1126833 RepID=A0A0D5NFU3_9BACL|nr:class I adenylate-forming enzyme family protein [Paenibacillus beijingensis]AJY73847.1 hypothetical protein VN24_03490 [Paenibacillus beijingensis]